MNKYQVSGNGQNFGTYEAENEQAARDAACVEAGYKSEAHYGENWFCLFAIGFGMKSELIATSVL